MPRSNYPPLNMALIGTKIDSKILVTAVTLLCSNVVLETSVSLYSVLQQQGLIGPCVSSSDEVASRCLIRCAICLAGFPSTWLLEQHTALQHTGQPVRGHGGDGGDDKPFQCDQCGQSYRYRSAYLKHREQNHRARLPADKLFTCDICGMQFRWVHCPSFLHRSYWEGGDII